MNAPGVALILLIGLYLLPTLIAMVRLRDNMMAIAALNILLGWTFVGWVISLVWALSSTAPASVQAAAPGALPPAFWELKRCPACAEKILKKALICRHCGTDIAEFTARRSPRPS